MFCIDGGGELLEVNRGNKTKRESIKGQVLLFLVTSKAKSSTYLVNHY